MWKWMLRRDPVRCDPVGSSRAVDVDAATVLGQALQLAERHVSMSNLLLRGRGRDGA